MKLLIAVTLFLYLFLKCASTPEEPIPMPAQEEPMLEQNKSSNEAVVTEAANPVSPLNVSNDLDIVTLKNGEVIEARVTTFTSDSLMVLDKNYKKAFYKKKDVKDVKVAPANESKCIEGNCINGKGSLLYADKTKYIGEFKDNLKSGKGTLILPDGGKYIGQYKDNLRDGQGTFTKPDGTKYVGGYKDGRPHGKGTLSTPDGTKYVGEFKDGKPYGKGTLSNSKGIIFSGQFPLNEKLNGKEIVSTNKKLKQKSSEWSDYQGIMTWDNAKAKCSSLAMRLPTKAELETAYNEKETEGWNADIEKDNPKTYWTSEESSDNSATTFSLGYGYALTPAKYHDNHVRCIR